VTTFSSPDMSRFTSRLHLRGRLTFATSFRIGAGRSIAVDEPDLPVLRTADGLPYIPGSSLKGALRSYVEAVLRTIQTLPDVRDRNLACTAVGKPGRRPDDDPFPHLCLFQNEVSRLKEVHPEEWHERLEPLLRDRLPDPDRLRQDLARKGREGVVDETLRALSCWTCRVLGAPWLGSKVLIKDLFLDEETFYATEVRDGVAIDRDTGRVAGTLKYRFEAVPAGATFHLEILVENASEAELGLLWIGIRALERGEVLLGGARSRGLGWCQLQVDREGSRYVTQENLLDVLFGSPESLLIDPDGWMKAFAEAVGIRPEAQGGTDAQETAE